MRATVTVQSKFPTFRQIFLKSLQYSQALEGKKIVFIFNYPKCIGSEKLQFRFFQERLRHLRARHQPDHRGEDDGRAVEGLHERPEGLQRVRGQHQRSQQVCAVRSANRHARGNQTGKAIRLSIRSTVLESTADV